MRHSSSDFLLGFAEGAAEFSKTAVVQQAAMRLGVAASVFFKSEFKVQTRIAPVIFDCLFSIKVFESVALFGWFTFRLRKCVELVIATFFTILANMNPYIVYWFDIGKIYLCSTSAFSLAALESVACGEGIRPPMVSDPVAFVAGFSIDQAIESAKSLRRRYADTK